jgi:RNA polymerase sigma-70 factor (ECF subfamily)
MDERPEEGLVDEARRGGREAFAELVRRHERRVHGVVFRMSGNRSDADDLAQEVFLTAWKAIGSFRRGSSFYTWLYRIAVNTSLTFLKKKGREKSRAPFDESIAVAGRAPGAVPSPEGISDLNELKG